MFKYAAIFKEANPTSVEDRERLFRILGQRGYEVQMLFDYGLSFEILSDSPIEDLTVTQGRGRWQLVPEQSCSGYLYSASFFPDNELPTGNADSLFRSLMGRKHNIRELTRGENITILESDELIENRNVAQGYQGRWELILL
jgi:hypothetical protein